MNIKSLKLTCKNIWRDLHIISAARLAITSDDPDGFPQHHLKAFKSGLKSAGLTLHTRQSQHGEYEYILAKTHQTTPKKPNQRQWRTAIAAGQILHPDPSFADDTDLWTIAAQAGIIQTKHIPQSHRQLIEARLRAPDGK